MMRSSLLFVAVAIITLTFSSCRDPNKTNPDELITTVRLEMTRVDDPTNIKVLQWKDTDGDGGAAPVITADVLDQLVTYKCAVKFFNESVTPAKDVTLEIAEEAADHQVFFKVTNLNGVFVYDDIDVNNNPVGLKSVVAFSGAGTGKIKVTLRHEPNKSAPGVKEGNITNAGGSTDIEVEFPNVQVQ